VVAAVVVPALVVPPEVEVGVDGAAAVTVRTCDGFPPSDV
jgi:hypothetical protein